MMIAHSYSKRSFDLIWILFLTWQWVDLSRQVFSFVAIDYVLNIFTISSVICMQFFISKNAAVSYHLMTTELEKTLV